jgi:pimeloyl-ACP methyl ester carboxylesterase
MEKVFAYNNVQIHYRVEGEGMPVVLLHGFGEDSRVFKDQVSFLKEHCRLLIPDLPGSGKSALLQDDEASITSYADCVYALLQHENIQGCILLGHSLGGYITLVFAKKYPQTLLGFGLLHSTAFADTDDKKETRKKGIDFIKKHGAHQFLKTSIPNLFGNQCKEQRPQIIEDLVEKAKGFSDEALIQYYQAMISREDTTDVLEQTKVPVLFILGTEDMAAPLKDVLQQVALPAVSHVHVLQSVGHMGMLELPQAVNKHLLSFVFFVQC